MKTIFLYVYCSIICDVRGFAAVLYDNSLSLEKMMVGTTPQTISFVLTDSVKVFPCTSSCSFSLTGSSSSGLPIYYESSSTVATISGTMITVVASGSATITARQTGDATYNTASPVSFILKIKENQSIGWSAGFTSPLTKTYQDPPSQISVVNLIQSTTTQYTSSQTDVAIITGMNRDSMTIVGAGTTVLSAQALPNSLYVASNIIYQTLTVLKKQTTLSFSIPSKRFGDTPFKLTAQTNNTESLPILFSSAHASIATLSGGDTVHIQNVGSVRITAYQPDTRNYESADKTDTLVVQKGFQTLILNPISAKQYGDTFRISYQRGASSMPVVFVSSNTNRAYIKGDTIICKNVGTVNITANQSGDNNYITAVPVTINFTINKANQTLSITTPSLIRIPIGYDFNSPYPPITLTATGGNSSGFDNIFSLTGGRSIAYLSDHNDSSELFIRGLGSISITVNRSGDELYNDAIPATKTISIMQEQSITFATLVPQTYGDNPMVLSASATSGLDVSYISSNSDIVNITGNTATILRAGEVNITANQTGNIYFYPSESIVHGLTIHKKSQSITSFSDINSPPKTYTSIGQTFTLAAALDVNGHSPSFRSSDTQIALVVGTSITTKKAGTVTITAYHTGNTNYLPIEQTQVLTIQKAGVSITFPLSHSSFIYNTNTGLSSALSLSNTSIPILYSSAHTSIAVINGNTVSFVGTGSTSITAYHTGNENYLPYSVSHPITVSPTPITNISIVPISRKVFGTSPFIVEVTGNNPMQSITFISSNTNIITFENNTATIQNAGTTTITANALPGEGYSGSSHTVNITIQKANQILTFNPLKPRIYHHRFFVLSPDSIKSTLPIQFTSSAPLVASLSGNTVTILKAGITIITASNTGNNNYNPISISQLLTIQKTTPLMILDTPLIFRYVNAKPFLLQIITSNVEPSLIRFENINPQIAEIREDSIYIRGVGTTTIDIIAQPNENYESVSVSQTIVVAKIPQTILFDIPINYSITDPPISLNANAGTSGIPIEYISSDTSRLQIHSDSAVIKEAGEVKLILSQQGNSNYEPAPILVKNITIRADNKLINNIEFTNPLPKYIYTDTTFALTASSLSNTDVFFSITKGKEIASLQNNMLTIKKNTYPQTITIRAYTAGNETYKSIYKYYTISVRNYYTLNIQASNNENARIDYIFVLKNSKGNIDQEVSSTDGRAMISGIRVGTYFIIAIPQRTAAASYIPTYYTRAVTIKTATPIVCDDDIFSKTIQWEVLPKPITALKGTINGTVFNQIHINQNTPYPLIIIALLRHPDNTIIDATTTNSDGTFSFINVPNGEYTIIADIMNIQNGTDKITITQNESNITLNLLVNQQQLQILKPTHPLTQTKDANPFVSIYPNPMKNILTLSFHNNSSKTIQVYTASGMTIYRIETTQKQIQITTEKWEQGTYLIQITSDAYNKTFQIVK